MKQYIHCGKRFNPHPAHVKLCRDCDTWLVTWAEWVKALFDRHPDYFEYIQSPSWKRRADAAKKRAGYRCQVCNSPDRLEAHHRTYERLGHERPDDITVLCAKHHRQFHKE